MKEAESGVKEAETSGRKEAGQSGVKEAEKSGEGEANSKSGGTKRAPEPEEQEDEAARKVIPMRTVHDFMDELSMFVKGAIYKDPNKDKGYTYLETLKETTQGDGKKRRPMWMSFWFVPVPLLLN